MLGMSKVLEDPNTAYFQLDPNAVLNAVESAGVAPRRPISGTEQL